MEISREDSLEWWTLLKWAQHSSSSSPQCLSPQVLSNNSSMEKKSDSEEGQQKAAKGRERKASKTSNGESDREASRTEKRLSSSTPTLAVQQSLDCDFGDKLHTAKVSSIETLLTFGSSWDLEIALWKVSFS